jgi:hypothetical protein
MSVLEAGARRRERKSSPKQGPLFLHNIDIRE